MSGAVALRPAAPADLDAVAALNAANVPEVGPTTMSGLQWFLDHAEDFTVAVDADGDGDVVGFVIALAEGSSYPSPNYRWFANRYRTFLYVDRVAVEAVWRRRGVAAALYEHLVSGGSGRWPVLCAEVNVEPRNDASLRFHHRFGFEIVGEEDDLRHGTRVAMLARPLPDR